MIRSLLGAVAAVFLACGLCAQNAPLPAAPFPAPISGFAGRLLDSSNTLDFQFPNRTLRAFKVKVAPELNRVFAILGGGAFGAYDLQTFGSRLGGPLTTAPHGEKFLLPDMLVEPEAPGSGWTTYQAEGQDRLFDFDWDDRGYIYIAASIWGWGIVDIKGKFLGQVPVGGTQTSSPLLIPAFRNGARYYAIVSEGSPPGTFLYDVTDPSMPIFVRTMPFGLRGYAKVNNGTALALVTQNSSGGTKLQIFDTATLAAGGSGVEVLAPSGASFVDVASDGLNFFGLAANGSFPASYSVVRTAGTSPQTTIIDSTTAGFPFHISYGAGYITVSGSSTAKGFVVMYATGSATKNDLTPYLTSTYPSTVHFTLFFFDAPKVFANSGRPLLIAPFYAIGDVYALAASLANAELSITDTAPATVPIGQALTHDLVVKNNGAGTARGIVVTDTLPMNAAVGAVSAAGWNCNRVTGPLICTMAALDSGATASIHIPLTVPAAPGAVRNSATVAADNPDSAPANNSASSTTAAVSPAVLVGTSAAATSGFIGEAVTYTVTLTNSGPSMQFDNPGDEFTDVLPPNVKLVNASSTSGTAVANVATNTVTWNGPLAASASTTITMNGTVVSGAAGAIVSNPATIRYDADGDGLNDSNAATSAQFTIARAVTVAATFTVPAQPTPYGPNATVTYIATLTNSGPRTQNDNPGDEFTDVLPAGLSLVDAAASSGQITTDPSSVHWNGSIVAGGSVRITITARVASAPSLPSTISNQATVRSDANGDGSNETTTLTEPAVISLVVVAVPALSPSLLIALTLTLALAAAAVLREP